MRRRVVRHLAGWGETPNRIRLPSPTRNGLDLARRAEADWGKRIDLNILVRY
jgi:hypothetical protein